MLMHLGNNVDIALNNIQGYNFISIWHNLQIRHLKSESMSSGKKLKPI